MDLFQPDTKRCKQMIDKARKVNARRDAMDRRNGFAPPSTCDFDIQLRTILSALYCGIEQQDWSSVAEAAAMLQDTEVVAKISRLEGRPVILPSQPIGDLL